MKRIYPKVHTEGLKPGEWADVDDVVAARLLSMEFASLTDPHGNGPPAVLRRLGCC